MQTRARTKRQKQQQRNPCWISVLPTCLLHECGRFLGTEDLKIAQLTSRSWRTQLPKPLPKQRAVWLPFAGPIDSDSCSHVYISDVHCVLPGLPEFPKTHTLHLLPENTKGALAIQLDEVNLKFPNLRRLTIGGVVPRELNGTTFGSFQHLQEVSLPYAAGTDLRTLLHGSCVVHLELEIGRISAGHELCLPFHVQRLTLLTKDLAFSTHKTRIEATGLLQFASSYLVFNLCNFSHPERLESLRLNSEPECDAAVWAQGYLRSQWSLRKLLDPFTGLTSLTLTCLHFRVGRLTQSGTIKRLELSFCPDCFVPESWCWDRSQGSLTALCSAFPAVEHFSLKFSALFPSSGRLGGLPTTWLKTMKRLRSLTVRHAACLKNDLARKLRTHVPLLETLRLFDIRLPKPERFLLPKLKWLELNTQCSEILKEPDLREFLQNASGLRMCVFAKEWCPVTKRELCEAFPLIAFKLLYVHEVILSN